MNVTQSGQTIAAPPAALEPEPGYEACDQCAAPVDADQRYCVVCGTRRKHAYDPAARFLSGATRRSRSVATAARAGSPRKRRSFGLGTAAVLAAIPLAVAVGVLVGNSGNSADSKLLAALRAQKPTVVNVGGGGGAASAAASDSTAASTPVATLTSDFSLQRGYAVELRALPGHGTTLATATAAERAARAKGATAVGLITPSGFRVTPSPPAGDYVIYSGQYKAKAAANSALAKLKHSFPAARVIAVQSTAAAGGSGKVLSSSSFGSAHQVAGFKPTASQLAAGAQVANRVGKEINSNYVNSQKGLPDSVSVP